MKIITVGLTVALICLAGLTVSRSASAEEPLAGKTKEVSTVTDMKMSGSARALEIETIAREKGVTISDLEIEYQRTSWVFPSSSAGPFVEITVRGTAANMPALSAFRDKVKAIEGARVPSVTLKALDGGEFGALLVAVFEVK